MKTARFPLYAKILLWFFLNLLALGVGIFILGSTQFRIGPELLAIGGAGERIRSLAEVIADELDARPRPEWDRVLDTFGKRFGIEFLLFRNDGGQISGTPTTLPALVQQRLTERNPRGPLPRPEELDGAPPPEREAIGRQTLRRNGPPPPRGELDGPRPPDGPRGGRPPFLVKTDNPRRYWIGVALRAPERPAEVRRGPATLLIVSPNLRAGGLLLDFSVWLWVGVGAIVFSAIFWFPLVRSITRSVSQMESATAQIADGKFDVRVSDRRRDELGSLGGAINRMASRLAGFVSGQKRFTGDIAHELCSPIARMQMAVGILEQRADPKDKPYVDDLRDEVQHMSGLVNELLSFSKASLGATNIRLEMVALRPLIDRAVRREARDGAEIRIEVPDDVQAVADPELVVRAVSNLLRNAVHYAGSAGPITVSAQRLETDVELVVADSGPGVPESELPKLCDPFYRVDTSRARETGGAGLGLSIVKTCIESCHGSVTCRNRQPSGLEVVLRLPR